MTTENRWNGVRFDPRSLAGHVESLFFIGQDEYAERALWVKATIFAPKGRPGDAQASAWVIGVERSGRIWTVKDSGPWCPESGGCDGWPVDVAGLTVEQDAIDGEVKGQEGASARLDVHFAGPPRPLAMLFHDVLYELPWPRFKLVTPLPQVDFVGGVDHQGVEWSLDGWTGMQGHNWGQRHPDRYAWMFCNAWDGDRDGDRDGDDKLVVEAFALPGGSGPTMRGAFHGGLAGAVVRIGAKDFPFNGALQLVRNRSWVSGLAWGLRAEGPGGRLTCRVWARPERTAGLQYRNPDGTIVMCANSPLASMDLILERPDGTVLHRTSARAVLETAGPFLPSGVGWLL